MASKAEGVTIKIMTSLKEHKDAAESSIGMIDALGPITDDENVLRAFKRYYEICTWVGDRWFHVNCKDNPKLKALEEMLIHQVWLALELPNGVTVGIMPERLQEIHYRIVTKQHSFETYYLVNIADKVNT